MRDISENPHAWVILKIPIEGKEYYKIFGSWRGGYSDGDAYKLSSGISSIEDDDTNYYFNGLSGSCYKCPKNGYGIAGSYASYVLKSYLEKSPEVSLLSIEECISTIRDIKLNQLL